jgi:hypothetical protein
VVPRCRGGQTDERRSARLTAILAETNAGQDPPMRITINSLTASVDQARYEVTKAERFLTAVPTVEPDEIRLM